MSIAAIGRASQLRRSTHATSLHVVLAAHGAGDESAANRNLHALAPLVEQALAVHTDFRHMRVRVRAAFHNGRPSVAEVLTSDFPGTSDGVGQGVGDVESSCGATAVVLPILASDGFHASRLRDSIASRPGSERVVVLPPIGTSGIWRRTLVERVVSDAHALVVADMSGNARAHPRTCAVLIVAHGTTKSPTSRNTAFEFARELVEVAGPSLIEHTACAFLDDEPDITTALHELTGLADERTPVLVVPFLIGGGPHHRSDVPERTAAACTSLGIRPTRVVVTRALGENEEIAALCAEVIRASWTPTTPFTTPSSTGIAS